MDYRHVLQHGTVLDRKYRIERVIGSGGFGITYEAFDLGLATPVAIKEYYPAQFGMRDATLSIRARSDNDRPIFERLLASFIREARTLARFDHVSIVRVFNVFEAHGTAYMVMKYELGPSLKQWLAELGRQPSQFELDRIAAPVLDALETLHAADFLHRDIAPDNIIIRADGTPVILDFGASRRVVTQMTGTVTGIVKQGYSPQEQYATDGRQQGAWTDIYAFGATLYRAIAGDAPNESTERMLDDLMRPAVEFANGDYRIDFLEGLDWSLRLRPRERPQTIGAWRQKLFRGTHLEPAGTPATFPHAMPAHAAAGTGPRSDAVQSSRAPASQPSARDGLPPHTPASGAPLIVPAVGASTPLGHVAPPAPVSRLPAQRWSAPRLALTGGGLLVVGGLFVFALLPRDSGGPPQGNVAVQPARNDPGASTTAPAEAALRQASADADRRARDLAAQQQIAAARATAQRAAAEKAAAETAAAEKADAERAAKQATQKAAREQDARRGAALKEQAERQARADAAVKAAAEKEAAAKADADRQAAEQRAKAEAERITKAQAALPRRLLFADGTSESGIFPVATQIGAHSIISGGTGGHLRLWSVADGAAQTIAVKADDTVSSVAISPDDGLFAVGAWNGDVRIIDGKTGAQVRAIPGLDRWVSALRFVSPSRLAMVQSSGLARVVNPANGQLVFQSRLPGASALTAATLSRDGTLAVGALESNEVRGWTIQSGRLAQRFHGHSDWVLALDLTADGKMLISGGADRTARLWDWDTGHQLHSLSGHPGAVRAVALSPDGTLAATGGNDGSVIVWQTATGERITALDGHTNTVRSLSFGGDNRSLASSSEDGDVRIWYLEQPQ